MRKTILSKKVFISLLVAMLLCFSFGLFTATAYAEETEVTPKTVDQVTYNMASSAQVRISNDNDYKTNGLRFQASMSLKDYESLLAYGYDSLTFGIVIAPADYLAEGKDFTEENLFGDSAIYGWAEYDSVNGTWGDYQGDKTEIINIYKDELIKDTKNEIAYIRASITNLNYNNIARDFMARGYIIANNGQDYAMATYAEKKAFSMAYVAEKSIAIAEENEFNSAAGYLDQATCQSLSKTYLENDKIYNDMTSTVVKLNNYATDGNVVSVEGLGSVNYITDGKGNKFAFEQEGTNVKIDISDLNSDKEFEAILYTFDGTYYKLYKVTANYDNKTKITNVAEFNAMRSATSGDFVLANDITLTEELDAPTATFNATLDGNGKAIYGLVSNGAYGVFSTIGGSATVKNLVVIDAKLGGVQTGVIATFLSAGATLDNIYVSASISSGNHCGGLVKQVYGAEGKVTKVTNCVVNITDTTTWVATSGALFGFGSAVANVDLTGTYAITSQANATLVGNRGDSYATFRDKINALNTSETPVIFSNITKFVAKVSLNNETIIEDLGYSVVYINNATDLNNMRTASSTKNKYYILTTDITLSSTALDAPATNFYGVFDGNGHYIKNMNLNGTSKGLFNNLRFVVRNLALVDVVITGQAGAVCYATAADGSYTAVVENVYASIKSIDALGSGALIRNQSKTNDVVRDCVVYVKSVKDTIPTFTNTYADGSTLSALQTGFVAYSGTSTIKLSNNYFISDVSNLRVFGLSKSAEYDSTTETDAVKTLKEILSHKVYGVNEFKNDTTITVKDSALLSKII
ncbi:MAG: hypothetical protein J6U92_04085 [Clostridia bacterium]|nr:hypothetical protein [Clostridia bacterium]